MANSLMELYGGGLLGPSSNYQLGGRISRGRIGRGAESEAYELERKRKEAAKGRRKSGIWGTLGSLAGGAIGAALAPVTGGASLALATGLGAGLGRLAGEKAGYKETDFGEGKYLKEKRGASEETERDYRRGMGERALVSGAQAAIMPGMFKAAGKAVSGAGQFVKGIPTALEAGQEMGLTGMQAFGDYAKSFSPSSALAGASYNPLATVASGASMPTSDLGLASNLDYGMARDAYSEMNPDGGVSYLDYLKGLDLPGQGFFAGGGFVNDMVPQMQGGGSTNPYGYGTATGTLGALKQMGMGSVAADTRLKDYMAELPQFSQGYQQQFGDIQKGGRQALSQMYASQRNTGGGFAGAGAGAQAFGQQYSGLMGEQGRQRRGVVEGFQSDLLSGIRDIEQAGEFTFATGPTPWETLGITEEEYNKQMQEQQEALLAGAGDVGLLDPTQGQTGGNTSGWPGQQQQQQQQNTWQQQQQQTSGWVGG